MGVRIRKKVVQQTKAPGGNGRNSKRALSRPRGGRKKGRLYEGAFNYRAGKFGVERESFISRDEHKNEREDKSSSAIRD